MSNQRLASVIVIVHCRLHQFYTAAVECYNNDVAYQQGNIITELFLSYFYIEILRYQSISSKVLTEHYLCRTFYCWVQGLLIKLLKELLVCR